MTDRTKTAASTWATLPFRALLALMVMVIAASAFPLAVEVPDAGAADETPPAIGSEIIVVLEKGDDPRAAAAAMGVEVKHIYRHVFNGFAGTVTGEAPVTASASRARRPPKSIVEDGRVSAEAQFIPTGVSRVGVPKDPDGQHLAIPSQYLDEKGDVDADVAVLDTGVARTIADLNVQPGGINCVGGSSTADDNGHGTHVAGTIGARDNDNGVVGVAPGVRLWPVKVLDTTGTGSFSDVICGLDWVASRAGEIEVANLSLSGGGKKGDCSDGALHQAVCAVVNQGVTVVVAAGNQGKNADKRVPANFPEVITVSGISDADGLPGGLGDNPCFGSKDDVFLGFSNFGDSVDIAAPGGCIESYTPNGGIESASGTSAASPHVAGAAALFVAGQGSRPSPDQVRSWLLTEGSRPQAADGVTGDPDASNGKNSAKIRKLKQKIKKSNGKKSGKKNKKLKKRLKTLKNQDTQPGHLEPVLWLAGIGG